MKVASLLLAMVENPPLSHGRDGFYVAENGSRPIHPALHAAATVLYSMDLLDTDKPTLHAAEEPQHHIGMFAWADCGDLVPPKPNTPRCFAITEILVPMLS
ncbi:hypothetical protein AUP68_02428 [Ilyonectria robusta]